MLASENTLDYWMSQAPMFAHRLMYTALIILDELNIKITDIGVLISNFLLCKARYKPSPYSHRNTMQISRPLNPSDSLLADRPHPSVNNWP